MEPIIIRAYEPADIPAMRAIWNEVVEEGIAFPQEEPLDETPGKIFLLPRPTAGWRRMKTERFSDSISCTPIISADAVI